MIYLIKYKEQNTIEGYVKTIEEFNKWLKNHNKKRSKEKENIEHKEEFELIKIPNILEV